MLQGQSKASHPLELSYDDFVETYGRSNSIGSDSHSQMGEDSKETAAEVDNLSTSTSSFTTIAEDLPVTDFESIASINYCTEIDTSNTTPEDCNKNDLEMNFSSLTSEPKRRNSRFQSMANRLARKSFRAMKKKVSSDSPNLSRGRNQSSANANSKWNLMFKRSRSSSRPANEDQQVKSDVIVAEQECSHDPEVMMSSNLNKRIFARSMSHSHVDLTCNDPSCTASKRHSVSNEDEATKARLNKKFELMKHNYNKQYATVGCRRPPSRPTFLPLSVAPKTPQPFSPEYNVIRKCDDFREEEHTRLVAVATLLKRRRNSLKIKCDQFDKELTQKHMEVDKARVIRARLRQMKRKLEVVDQCIEEQKEEMKTTSAKIDLLLSLELYKLDLAREEKTGFNSRKTSPLKSGTKYPFPISASCETLLDMDDPSVFDDTSSMTSSKKMGSTHSSPTRSNRRSSVSSGNPHTCFSPEELAHKTAVRSQSIDNTVTSDCDSGFDNGDGLSRSDISLNLSFSKSTCSIASSSSHGNHPRSASCQDSSSSASRKCFFPEKPHSSSELSLFSPKTPFVLSSTSSNLNDSRTVDPSVLAAIEDFEKFAEKTKRRLSLHGKLIPLKKGL